MKKLLLLLCLALVSTGVFAQEGINIKAAFSMTDFMGDKAAKAKPGFRVGFGYDYCLGEILYLQPSLMVAAKGAQYTEESQGTSASKTINSLYVELPVLLAAKIDMDLIKQRRFSIGVGPYAAYGIGGNTTYSGNWSGRKAADPTFGDLINMRRFDAGVAVALGLEFGNFLVSLDGQLGLVELWKESNNAKNLALSLSVGFRF